MARPPLTGRDPRRLRVLRERGCAEQQPLAAVTVRREAVGGASACARGIEELLAVGFEPAEATVDGLEPVCGDSEVFAAGCSVGGRDFAE